MLNFFALERIPRFSRFAVLGTGLLMTALTSSSLSGQAVAGGWAASPRQTPPTAQVQSRGLGNTPHLWVAPKTRWGRSASVTTLRAATQARQGGAASPARSSAATGVMQQLIVPVLFSDTPLSTVVDSTSLAQQWFGSGTALRRSASSYWQTVSRGTFTVQATVVRPIRLSRTRGYYTGTFTQFGGVADRLDDFVREATIAVDAANNLAGLGDAEDSLSRIPAVVFVQVGQGLECGQPAGVSAIAAHRFSVSTLLGRPYVSTDSIIGSEATVKRGATIDDYIVLSGQSCQSTSTLAGIGTLVHETGHLLGLPDLYDVTDPMSAIVGHWDLMSTGNLLDEFRPPAMGAWSRGILGWWSPTPLTIGNNTDTAQVRLARSLVTGEGSSIDVGDSRTTLLVEDRRRAIAPDEALPGEGWLVWQIDASILTDIAIRNNRINTNRNSPGIRLLSADGRDDLIQSTNRGDATDPWLMAVTDTLRLNIRSIATQQLRGRLHMRRVSGISPDIAGLLIGQSADSSDVPAGGWGTITVTPDSLPRGVAGLPYLGASLRLLFSRDSVGETATVTWRPDTLALRQLGLSVDSAVTDTVGGVVRRSVRLFGSLPETARTTTLRVFIDITSGNAKRTIEKSWIIVVLEDGNLPLEVLLRAVLSPTEAAALPRAAVQFYDVRGNTNGTLDMPDIVIGLQRGIITRAKVIPAPSSKTP